MVELSQMFEQAAWMVVVPLAASLFLVVLGLWAFTKRRRHQSELSQMKAVHDALMAEYQASVAEHKKTETALFSANKMVDETHLQIKHTEAFLQKDQARLVSLQQQYEAEQQSRREFESKASALTAQCEQMQQQYQDLKAQLAASQSNLMNLQQAQQVLLTEKAQLETTEVERTASHRRELERFEAQKEELTNQFKLLANDILESKAKSLDSSSQVTLDAVMKPYQQSLEAFKKEVQAIHHRETEAQGALRQELDSLKTLNHHMTQEAHELATALRGQKKLQGNWGELILENVLERSGLQEGKDYRREVSFTTEEGRLRPDAVIYMPQEKHLVIDAKTSLNAYTRFVNATDDLSRAQALKEHVAAVADRIKELANKGYDKLPGLKTPEMVFMFIPIESAFVEALKADETLFQQAIEQKVLVATPTTLLTSLNIIRQLWRYEDQNKHSLELAQKAESVFQKLRTFLESFEKVKKSLEQAQQHYLTAENQLVGGRGNLVKQVNDFKTLAPKIRHKLPMHYEERATLEIDQAIESPSVLESI